MGGEGQYGYTPPFFNLRKSPQEMTHTQREEGSAQAQLAQQRTLRGGRAQEAGPRAGPCDGTAKPGRMFSSSPQHLRRGNRERKDSMFLT